MAEPVTVNLGLIVPNTGDLPGTWGPNALNLDLSDIDGQLAGVATVGLSNAPVTLTSSGASITPGPGPYQANNAVLRFTGTQTANITVSLPLPGYYIVENLLTGNTGWVFFLASGIAAGEYICIDRGMRQHIYHDGANVRFVDMGVVGHTELWAAYSAIPAWVSNCSVPPYLLCDGSTYSYSTYPALGNKLGGTFGGNGVTTFGVPDLRGRVPLAYDPVGRITSAGCGLNGQQIGASLDQQTVALSLVQLPAGIQSSGTNSIAVYPSGNSGLYAAISSGSINAYSLYPGPISGSPITPPTSNNGSWSGANSFSGNNTQYVTSNNTGGGAHNNVQPSLMTGIWVIKAA